MFRCPQPDVGYFCKPLFTKGETLNEHLAYPPGIPIGSLCGNCGNRVLEETPPIEKPRCA